VVDAAPVDTEQDAAGGDRHDHDGDGDVGKTERVAEHARQDSIGGVAGVVERLVARDLIIVDLPPDDAERQGRNERGDAGISDADDELR
jgi:hypothetical protein